MLTGPGNARGDEQHPAEVMRGGVKQHLHVERKAAVGRQPLSLPYLRSVGGVSVSLLGQHEGLGAEGAGAVACCPTGEQD